MKNIIREEVYKDKRVRWIDNLSERGLGNDQVYFFEGEPFNLKVVEIKEIK